MQLKDLGALLSETFKQWWQEDIVRMAAAVAYYAALSILPLLLMTTAIASAVFGVQPVENQIVTSIRDLVGSEGAESIRSAIEAFTSQSSTNLTVTLVSALALVFSASSMFRQLKGALNIIWSVPPAHRGKVRGFLVDTAISLLVVSIVSLLLLVAFVASTGLFFWIRSLDSLYPDLQWLPLWRAAAFVLLFIGVTLIFAVIYKLLPDAHVCWRDVWTGAAVTALLFMLGQLALAVFLSSTDMSTTYGAASAFMAVMLWVYVTAHLVLFGAEFTQVYANHAGRKVVPTAVPHTPGIEAGN